MATKKPNPAPRYQYSPWTAPSEQIRLCKIPPQPLSNKIPCELFTHSIEKLPRTLGALTKSLRIRSKSLPTKPYSSALIRSRSPGTYSTLFKSWYSSQ